MLSFMQSYQHSFLPHTSASRKGGGEEGALASARPDDCGPDGCSASRALEGGVGAAGGSDSHTGHATHLPMVFPWKSNPLSPASPPPPPLIHAPPYHAGLAAGVLDLIHQADAVVRRQGIDTDVDAAVARVTAEAAALTLPTSDQEEALGKAEVTEEAAVTPACLTDADCAPHGVCQDALCRCTVLYSGWVCGHAIQLGWPLLPPAMANFTPAYEGELMLHLGSAYREIRVAKPAGLPGWDLLADEATTTTLSRILPPSDLALKGKAYRTCAVVGSSGSLLLRRLGPAIEAHTLVLRLGDAPTLGHEASLGSKTNLRLTGDEVWGWHERPDDIVLVRARTTKLVEGLLANSAKPDRVIAIALDPGFESWVARGLGFEADTALVGVLLALQACRSVTLFGLAPLGPAAGVPWRYDQPCHPGDGARGRERWDVLRALAAAGMVSWGEPCVEECMDGTKACAACRAPLGIAALPPPACEALADGGASLAAGRARPAGLQR